MSRKLVLAIILIFVLIGMSGVVPELHIVCASPYTNINVDTAYNMITNGSYPDLVVLDVRTRSEYDDGHIYGSVLIPHTELEARIEELLCHQDHGIIIYCRAGVRSVVASEILDSHNFTKVYNMLGGIQAWESAGYPVWVATVHNVNTAFNYDTIQAAINAPQTLDGHTIFVEEGIYYEHVVVDKSVKLVGESVETTIIDSGEVENVMEVTANNITVISFTIRNSDPTFSNSGIKLSYAKNCNVSGNNIINNYYGIMLGFSSNISICGNNIINNYGRGIYLVGASYTSISENNITGNHDDGIWIIGYSNSISGNNITNNTSGIHLRGASIYNSIFGNTITANRDTGIRLFTSPNNSITGNNIRANNANGIRLGASKYNSISENNLTNNYAGIQLSESSFNSIFHNNFMENQHHALTYGSYENSWDDGYLAGGNYWSNYSGVDSDYDGIGDTRHIIDINNQDSHPLMGMFHSFNTSLGYHVNVISNSTIDDFQYFESNSTIRMLVSNMTANQTFGFCRLAIPHDVLSPPYSITINDNLVAYTTVFENETLSIIYFSYPHSTHEIVIIPEFSSLIILPLFMIATLLAVIMYRRKHTR